MRAPAHRAALGALSLLLPSVSMSLLAVPPELDAPERGIELGPWRLSGVLDQRYRFRETSSGRDQDLHGLIDLGAEYVPARDDSLRRLAGSAFRIVASHDLDIDAFHDSRATSSSVLPFFDATDTFDSRLRILVHQAYGELRGLRPFDLARVGRQSVHREESLYFDGAYLRSERWSRIRLECFGGLPVHIHESSASGDAIAGASAGIEITPDLDLGVDFVYSRDERRGGPDSEDHFYRAQGHWRPSREWALRASASWVDTEDRRQSLEARWISEATGLSARFRGLRQGRVVAFQSSELSPFVLVEGTYAPNYQVQADLDQPIGEHWSIGAGAVLRELDDSADEGLFNHSLRNGYVVLGSRELWPGMSASVQGDVWHAGDRTIWSAGFELEQELAGIVEVRVGSSFSLYRFDALSGVERERDRIYYARLRWSLGPRVDLDIGYQLEVDPRSEHHTILSGVRLWF